MDWATGRRAKYLTQTDRQTVEDTKLGMAYLLLSSRDTRTTISPDDPLMRVDEEIRGGA